MIDGFAIGHHTADGEGWLTGTTVVLARPGGRRGRRPGRRARHPGDRPARPAGGDRAGACRGADRRQRVRAGGGRRGDVRPRGGRYRVPGRAGPGQVVPIVPAAVIFDLGRGGDFGHRPTAEFGARALRPPAPTGRGPGAWAPAPEPSAVASRAGSGTPSSGSTPAVTVGAAVVVNAAGSPVEPGHRPAAGRPRAPAAGPDRGRADAPRRRVHEGSSLARHHHRGRADRRDADQGAGRQGGRNRPRRDGAGDRAGALDVRRRHGVRAGVGPPPPIPIRSPRWWTSIGCWPLRRTCSPTPASTRCLRQGRGTLAVLCRVGAAGAPLRNAGAGPASYTVARRGATDEEDESTAAGEHPSRRRPAAHGAGHRASRPPRERWTRRS